MISVIIPSYNSYRTLEQTLDSLKNQTRRDMIQEIQVLDSSDDGITKRIRTQFENNGIEWVDLEPKTIPAIARNIGAKIAQGELLVFIDSDVTLSQDWIENIADYYKKGYRLGGGSVFVTEFQKDKRIAWAQYFLQFNESIGSGEPKRRRILPSCNMFCDKEIFWSAHGFPPIRASEDTLFFLNASLTAQPWLIPKARAYHIFREDIQSFLNNQKLLGRYILRYRRDRWPKLYYYKGWWPLLFLPAFTFIKWVRFTKRIFEQGPALIFHYIKAFPYILTGLISWSFGFLQEAFRKNEFFLKISDGDYGSSARQTKIANVWYNNLTCQQALCRCLNLLEQKNKSCVFFLNIDCLRKAQMDKEYARILHSASLVLPDGIGLKLAARMFGLSITENLNGSDFSPLLMEEMSKRGKKIFLYGGKPGVARLAAIKLKKRIQAIQIVGTEHGYAQSETVMQKINQSGCDVLFVGLGVPLQEKWIMRHLEKLDVKTCFGVGALLNWISGYHRRCPTLLRRWCMEWLWRIIVEPRRMLKRYLVNDLFFLARVMTYGYRSLLFLAAV